MRWTPSLIISLLMGIGLIALGMWLIYSGTDGAVVAPPPPGTPAAVSAPPTPAANPGALGFGMLMGGVLIIFMAFRRV